ncbi:MAG: ABC transporter ATP-binding protein [Pseudomonadota bacterium]|nr:ABC transporter ATP-binding protein [Pseudomonadota bacterium]
MALLEVRQLSVSFHTRNGVVQAVRDVSFDVEQGKTLGIVGESGSGKSVCCYSLLGLIPMPPGRIEGGTAVFDGKDLLRLSEDELRQVRGNDIAFIFQDPMTCLNPYLTVGEQMMEPLVYHRQASRATARARAIELMKEVGIRDPDSTIDSYPHQFSGGMRQRVMIAMALIAEPRLLIADEPTTALDVTVQRQILQLINELRVRRNLGVIFVSHDLGVVAGLADQVLVMQNGVAMEQGPVGRIFSAPESPYTRKLLDAIPSGAKPVQGRATSELLLQVSHLTTRFRSMRNKGTDVIAVDDVSFDLKRGEVLGLVGESGSGKSTLGRSVLGLVPTTGSVKFDGEELVGKSSVQMQPWRRRMQMVFQDPYASLNPRMTIYDTLAEPLLLHKLADRRTLDHAVFSIMDDVGLARAHVRKYPHEFSGGQRQRIAIGRAISTRPELVIADEPVSALDVTIQKQILELLLMLVEKHNLSMLFISHDLAVVRYLCDRVMVMYKGKVLESGATEQLWGAPTTDYARALLSVSHDRMAPRSNTAGVSP